MPTNRFKPQPKGAPTDASPERNARSRRSLRLPNGPSLPTGRGLRKRLESNLALVALLTGLGLLYVWNAHYTERQARAEHAFRTQLKDLKSEYMTLNAKLSAARQHTRIREMADSLGLQPLAAAPFELPQND